ncbi:MAG: DsbA family protein [Hyphomicrobiales bacterium]|nr:DsbA family protein [Hyphomicrobiales bacterium]
MMHRRAFILAGGASVLGATAALAEKALLNAQGQEVQTWRLPSEITLDMPGVISAGSASPDAILYEFFDYNCPWCKKSVAPLDKLVRADKNLRLRLIQNPILSIGSAQCSKVVLATQDIAGDATAYALHKALLGKRGRVAGPEALAEAQALKLDAKKIEARADSEEIITRVMRQAKAAAALGMSTTPSFAMNGVGIGGWPGESVIARAIGNVRACDAVAC